MQFGIQGWTGVTRSVLFVLTGILFLVAWAVGPSFEMTNAVARWLATLLFSATLLCLAVALGALGRMVGGPWVIRLATIAASAAIVCSVANIFEDGFLIDWFFFVFVAGLLTLDVALVVLTIVVALRAPDKQRLLAAIPAGTLIGILVFPVAGGPILLITWLAAAIAARKMSLPQTQLPAKPATA